MADDTDELPASHGAEAGTETGGNAAPTRDGNEPAWIGWPLVERRRGDRTPPEGIERRRAQPSSAPTAAPTLSAAVIWPFRLAAVLGALIRAHDGFAWGEWRIIVTAVVMSAYTAYVCRHPLPYRGDRTTRWRIVAEQALNTSAVMLTGQWASPFVLFFVPTGMLAGFAAGAWFSIQLAAASVLAITARFMPFAGARTATQDGALWLGLLGLVAFTSGLAHRAVRDAALQQQVALDRVSRLAEANSLLFSLQRVAQTLPASLDLDEVLDSTVGRLRTMVRHEAMAVYVLDPHGTQVVPVRSHGAVPPRAHDLGRLPRGLRLAADAPKPVRVDDLGRADGVAAGTGSGLYAALRARGSLVGFIALECVGRQGFGPQQAEIVHGLSEPFGIAIDNARMFLRIRTLAADEERSRIARELHDHVGSSLALIGFEVDRALTVSADGGEVQPVLRELRDQVSLVVKDVRNTLFDLRTEVSDVRDLTTTAARFLRHVEERSGIRTRCDLHIDDRLPLLAEREVWQIVKEAILNAERHSHAEHLTVSSRYVGSRLQVSVRDDGVGLAASTARPDSYGITGMRERALRLDAELTVRSPASGGTELLIDLPLGGTTR